MSKVYRVEVALQPGDRVALDTHRFVNVLRHGMGDELVVCDAGGSTFKTRIVETRPLIAEVLVRHSEPDRNPVAPLEVWLPLLKGGRSDGLVRQLTELGATRIVPFTSRYTVVRLGGDKAEARRARFEAIAREACDQCGRTDRPEVVVPQIGLPTTGPGAFLWEGGGEPALTALSAAPELGARLLTGPEGGLEQAEANQLVGLGWRSLTVGRRILRAETAVVVLASLAQAVRGGLE